MADELNIPTHRWYEPRNNISLPKTDFSAQTIYASGIQKIDAWINSQPWGNPVPGLFALAEPGAWYDPSDLNTLFQDAAGTQPVTTPGQTVALALDKSKGLVLGTATSATGWTNVSWDTFSSTGGSFTASKDVSGGTDNCYSSNTVAATLGNFYEITLEVASITLPNFTVALSATTNNRSTVVTITGTGTKKALVQANVASGNFNILVATTAVGAVTISSISVRELPGNHATQATAASRPTYGVVPATGRRNLLTYTEQFNNAAWGKTATTVTANAGAAPDGTTSADLLVVTTATSGHSVDDNTLWSATSGTAYTASVFVKKPASNSARYFQITFGSGFFGATQYATYDLDTGNVSGSAVGTPSITDQGNGWFRCVFTVSATGSGTGEVFFLLSNAATGRAPSYAGNGTDSFLIWGAQLETGSTATAYQRVTTAFDVTEAGVQSLGYLSFDGVDDFLVTPTITPNIDKAQVFAGVRKLSDAAVGIVAELSAGVAANAGSFYLSNGTPSGSGPNWASNSRGGAAASSSQAAVSDTSFVSPVTSVLTATHDIAGDLSAMRVNGSANGTNGTADKGVGNFLTYPLYIGRRAGTTFPFNGQLYSLIIRFGANLDANTISQTETWVNGKTGAY